MVQAEYRKQKSDETTVLLKAPLIKNSLEKPNTGLGLGLGLDGILCDAYKKKARTTGVYAF